MPDPIRVTRAVRRCPWSDSAHREGVCDMPDCTDGWVDVPVDEDCPTCRRWTRYPGDGKVCPDCDGSGRRPHNWATGWCYQDEVMGRAGNVWRLAAIGGMHPDFPDDHALVLSDPSHRPEPMRWNQ